MLELFEFFVEGGDQEKSHVLLHITEPSASPEEKEKGYFFAVAEINNGTMEQIEHLQQMINDLESGYYETDDERNKNAFELTLEYINKRGHYILDDKNSELNCVVGVINKNRISFSYHGTPIIKIIYGKQKGFELMDIIENEKENPKKNQLFSAVMEGNINEGDFFFITTPHVTESISDKQVLNDLPTKGAEKGAIYFQNILQSLGDDMSYGGIICHYPTSKIVYDTTTDESEIEESNEIQTDETENIKEENIAEEEKPQIKHIPHVPKTETNYRPREIEEKEPITNVILVGIGRSLVAGVVGIYNLFKNIIVGISKIFIGLFLLITNFGGQRSTVIQTFNETALRQKNYIKNLPLISKILFVLTILLAIGFAGSTSYLRIKANIETRELAYKNQIQAIIDKKTAAEASMIYDDETKAFGLLKEAENMIKELPTALPSQKNKAAELQKEISESLKILQKLNVIKPEVIADLVQTQSSAKTAKLALINKDLIAYGPEDLFVYKINLDNKEVVKKEHQTIPYLAAADTPKEQDVIVFLTQDNNIAEYSPKSETFSSKDITLMQNAALSDIFVYSQRLYTVDVANNQIYKHNKTQTGYDKGTLWIKTAGVNLSDVVSISIDGDLLALKQNGEILKFTSGVQQPFAVSGLDPALDKPTEIWTYANVKNIYILEPTNKRVIILNKQGKMLQQYTANEWKNPTGMIVDEPNKVIYVLDSDKVYRFGIE